jgi:hypothetical protein
MKSLRQSKAARLIFSFVLCLTCVAVEAAQAAHPGRLGEPGILRSSKGKGDRLVPAVRTEGPILDCSGSGCVLYYCFEGPDASYCIAVG